MIDFIVLATVLAVICVAVIAVPLLKPVPSNAPGAPWAAGAAPAGFVLGAVGG